MKNSHPTDLEIQRFTFDQVESKSNVVKHILSCSECTNSVASYNLLAIGLKEQPIPLLDYDLADSVMSILPSEIEHVSDHRNLTGYIILLCLGSIALTLYFLNDTLHFLFQSNSNYLSPLAIYICLFIFSFLCFDTYRSFNKKFKRL